MAPARIADLISEPSGATLPSYVPVLIVGAGPVGLLEAYLLSRLNGKVSSAGTVLKKHQSDPKFAISSQIRRDRKIREASSGTQGSLSLFPLA